MSFLKQSIPRIQAYWSSPSQSDAYACERTIEALIFVLRRVDAAIHCAEEKIGAIASAHLEVLDAEGQARKAADIGHGHGARARGRIGGVVRYEMAVRVFYIGTILSGRLMMHEGLLPAEQNCGIHAPIEQKLAAL